MDAEAVARFLQENPAFFEQHPDLLAQISVPHPHGGPAIALADRQVLTLRERNRQLDHAQARTQMPTRHRDGINRLRTQLRRHLFQLGFGELMQVIRR